jgi:glycosyltransferase involved in cell wall biosynthesis
MRVGLVIYGGLEHPSGGFLYDRMLVETLRQAGDEVDVISLPWQTYGRCMAHNFDPGIRARLCEWKGDVLLQDELVHPSLFLLNRALRRALAVPLVSIVHHLASSERRGGFLGGAERFAERAYLRSVDGFVFNGEVTRRAVQELSGATCAGIVASPAGDRLGCAMTDAEAAARAADAPPLRVLFVGSLIPRKGLLTLLQALALSERGEWRLTVVGSRTVDPAHARQVDRFVKERGLQDLVWLKDHLDDGQLAEEFRAHHVLAVPSAYEGFGIVYLEAMGFGVVPIGSTSGGAGEVIEDGRSGFLVAPGDPKALADVIRKLGANRNLLGSCARAARQRFRRFPGWGPRMTEVRAWLHCFVEQAGN